MISIDLISKHDLSELAPIYRESYNSLNIGEKWNDLSSEDLLTHLYNAQSDLFFIARDDAKIIGAIVALIKPWWDGNHMTDGELFVDPKYQGKGVGKLLIKRLFEAGKSKYGALVWDTFTHQIYEHPLSWYKKMGFEEIKEWVMISGNVDVVLAKLAQEERV